MHRHIAALVLLAILAVGCFGTERDWVYPGKGWSVDVSHYDYPERIYYSETGSSHRPGEGFKILALWLTVANLDDRFSYDLRSEVASWLIVDGNGQKAAPMVRNYNFADALPTQESFVFGHPRSGYLYFRVHEDFDIEAAILEFRFYGMGQGHLVVVDLSDVQPLSSTM